MVGPSELLELMYAALREPLGLKVMTNDPDRLRQKLYQARNKSGDPQLLALTFSASRIKPDSELLIIRRKKIEEQDNGQG